MRKPGVVEVKGFMRIRDILQVFPVSRSTWFAGVKSGRYPKGYNLSERVTAWKVEDIEKLISNQPEVLSQNSDG